MLTEGFPTTGRDCASYGLNRAFTITYDHVRIIRDGGLDIMAPRDFGASAGGRERVLIFPGTSAQGRGEAALDLVFQAADVFRDMEEQARQAEFRAEEACRSATERVRLAEQRAEAAERAQRELLVSAEQRLRAISRELEQAKSRIAIQADQLTATEFRAQAVETEAREAKQALALVEEAIRRRLLCTPPAAERILPAAE